MGARWNNRIVKDRCIRHWTATRAPGGIRTHVPALRRRYPGHWTTRACFHCLSPERRFRVSLPCLSVRDDRYFCKGTSRIPTFTREFRGRRRCTRAASTRFAGFPTTQKNPVTCCDTGLCVPNCKQPCHRRSGVFRNPSATSDSTPCMPGLC